MVTKVPDVLLPAACSPTTHNRVPGPSIPYICSFSLHGCTQPGTHSHVHLCFIFHLCTSVSILASSSTWTPWLKGSEEALRLKALNDFTFIYLFMLFHVCVCFVPLAYLVVTGVSRGHHRLCMELEVQAIMS